MARRTLSYWNWNRFARGLRGLWQQALHSGWIEHRRGRWSIRFGNSSRAQRLGAEGRCSARPAWIYTDYHDRHAHLTGGGTAFSGGLLSDTTNSFVYDPVADSSGTIADIPRATGETRALTFENPPQMWVVGGGRTSPNPSNEVDIYDPLTNTWSIGTPFVTARRNFPTDIDGSTVFGWLAVMRR